MGGIEYAVPQELVAKGMEHDFDSTKDASENPAFLYITGDCVYFNGQILEYYKQFYQPYEFYHGPIFAVPGNHDGENLEGDNTLDGFVRNFCAPRPIKLPESQDSHRTAMTQPNVYWTLLTPLFNIVGLYSNVPAGGDILAADGMVARGTQKAADERSADDCAAPSDLFRGRPSFGQHIYEGGA